jgi:serine/threonine protein kinase
VALEAGSTLGAYEIVAPIGAGGMGEVYRARDTRLNRVVALKTLSPSFRADVDRRARFEREAKAIAALNHPGIVTIHSIEEADGTPFLTMELVEGRTLAALLPRHGWPIDRLLAIAVPLADAVAAAHARAITHRDLKPANVIVTPENRVKVLDFGLAKLRLDGDSRTIANQPTALATAEGHILGTVAYMSPEQAEGRAIDERSDLFSLGVILYEMATGERPFTGDTPVSILSSIIKDTPPAVHDVRPDLPGALTRIVRRALVKDVDHRYQSAKDLRNDLEELKQDLDSGALKPGPNVAGATKPRRSRAWITGVGVFALAAIALLLWWSATRSTSSTRPLDVVFTQITSTAGIERHPSLSPDGKWVVYSGPTVSGPTHIFLQGVGGQNAIDLTKDSKDVESEPQFSPDGEQIVFRSTRQGGGLFVMGRTGEFVRRVSAAGFSPSWSPDSHSLVYTTVDVANPYGRLGVGELWVVAVGGGEPRRIFAGDAVQPTWSPHGNRIAFWAVPSNGGSQRDIFTVSAAGGAPVAVTNDDALDASPAWSADGRFLYFVSDRGGTLNLWRVPIDEDGGARSAPEPVTTPTPFDYELTVSGDGHRLAFAAFTYTSNVQRWQLDPAAGTVVSPGAWITSGSTPHALLTVSPDGRRLATTTRFVRENLSVVDADADRSKAQQITDDRARNRWPAWSPNGEQIAFSSNRGTTGVYDVWIVNSDGSNLRQVTEGLSASYLAWSPNGLRIAATDPRRYDTWLIDPRRSASEQLPEHVPPPPAIMRQFICRSWSPDGRRLAGPVGGSAIATYDFDSKTYDLVLSKYPDAIATPVRWFDSKRILFLAQGQRLMMLDTATHQVREVLSAAPDSITDFATTPDGRQLFITRGSSEADIWMATIR